MLPNTELQQIKNKLKNNECIEFEVIAAEPMRDRPEEISAPKTQFDAIVNYADAVDFVQGNFLEHFYQPFLLLVMLFVYLLHKKH